MANNLKGHFIFSHPFLFSLFSMVKVIEMILPDDQDIVGLT
jgi:hypothetical protein